VAQHLPTLPALIPFLEVAQDQEYLLARLKVEPFFRPLLLKYFFFYSAFVVTHYPK
jgi:hypothetical protein